VVARLGEATPPVVAVVLDLSDTPAIDDDARAALLSLHGLLARGQARLRLVRPEAATRAAPGSDGAASTAGLDAFHPTVRAALLAAHAALPGPALVTPAMRALLMDPPELLLLPPGPPGGRPLSASAFRRIELVTSGAQVSFELRIFYHLRRAGPSACRWPGGRRARQATGQAGGALAGAAVFDVDDGQPKQLDPGRTGPIRVCEGCAAGVRVGAGGAW
jgi:hypothetical protein